MSRSGYSEDYDGDEWATIRWRGAVASAIRGARGQAFLKEMLAAMDAMKERRLIADALDANGEVCAIGAVGAARHIDMTNIDPEDRETVAGTFGIAGALAAEIVWMNDEAGGFKETPETRYVRMRRWAESLILAQGIEAPSGGETHSGSTNGESPVATIGSDAP